jgi:hypothetical protein
VDEREVEREERWALMQEPALARAPRHFVSMCGGPFTHKVINP